MVQPDILPPHPRAGHSPPSEQTAGGTGHVT